MQSMKTTVIMERDLNGFKVRQNSKTNMFCASDLLDVHNINTTKNRRMDSYTRNAKTKSYIQTILNDINSDHTKTWYLEKDVIKGNKGVKNRGTWMHPYLFIDFAMWLSDEFRLNCVKWIYDNLIKIRNKTGDSFKDVNAALKVSGATDPLSYIREAKMINKLALGSPSGGQRNSTSEEKLELLDKLQKADTKLIKGGQLFNKRVEILQNLKSLIT